MASKVLKILLATLAATLLYVVLGIAGLALAALLGVGFMWFRHARAMRWSEALLHALAVILIVFGFYLSLGLGLQVDPAYGNIGLALVALLTGAYFYFGWVQRKRPGPLA